MPTIRVTDDSSAAAPNPWDFWVDNQTGSDDYTKINNAVAAATSYALANGGYAAIRFEPRTYTVDGALQTSQQGNAQIPLPIIDDSQPSVTLAFLGLAPYAAPNPYFHQTGIGVGGTKIKTTLTGQTYSSSFGAPSVIGGPTNEQGWGYIDGVFATTKFANLTVIIDGITVATEFENGAGTMAAVHLGGVSKAHIQSLSCLADATLADYQVATNKPVNTWSTGLYMPQDQNADNCYIGTYSAYGFYTALFATEHVAVQRLLAVYCYQAIDVHAQAWHGVTIDNASVEACQIAVTTSSSSGALLHCINIGMLDCENMGFYNGDAGTHINDPSNVLGGIINIIEPGGGAGAAINLNGAANITVNNLLTRKV